MFFSTRRSREHDTFDDWPGAPPAGRWPTIFGGVAVPVMCNGSA